MTNADRVVYLDSSAVLKLVVRESESDALRSFLRATPTTLVSSALAKVEVARAVRPVGREAIARADAVLGSIELLAIGDGVLERAASLEPDRLRGLDAIHLASALVFGTDLDIVLCYDLRLAEAASALDLRVEAPA